MFLDDVSRRRWTHRRLARETAGGGGGGGGGGLRVLRVLRGLRGVVCCVCCVCCCCCCCCWHGTIVLACKNHRQHSQVDPRKFVHLVFADPFRFR